MKTASIKDQKKSRYTFLNILEGLEGIAIIIACYLTLFLKPLRARWGVSKQEASQVFPGDEIIKNPDVQFTHAVKINAPVEAVFPWIAQIGQGRGGFYSYEALENLGGMDVYNSEEIIREYQNPKLGDLIPFTSEDAYPLVVCEKNKAMAIGLCLDMATGKQIDPTINLSANYLNITWLWFIQRKGEKRCNFYSRNRITYQPSFKNNLIHKWLAEPIIFAMDRKMCLGIKRRAEKMFRAQEQNN